MNFKWFEAGYCVVSDGAPPKGETRGTPSRFVTVSDCHADVYPDWWALPWNDVDVDWLRSERACYELDNTGVADLRGWVAQAMDDGRFGWPHVFFELDAAREFRRRFLRAIPGTRVVGLSVEADVARAFLRDEALQGGDDGSGIWTMLSRGTPLLRRDAPLGFEVLGAESDGTLHTLRCNEAERELVETLGVAFNAHGLIRDYAQAVAASAYLNRDDVAAEPVPWYPFRLDERRAE